ncbi:hypothetical protein AI2615V1_2809 [Enterobacter cloacae]|nr:hypothetical protein ASU71_08700 [Enterobacter hormaechei subsp. hoffmannii]CAE7315115.1 hypothetical protein AI2615V1_2809 [Enterobacter cloacae]CAH3661189.1 hypothetical protein AI2615V1_2809 [Enterobacter cloacae]
MTEYLLRRINIFVPTFFTSSGCQYLTMFFFKAMETIIQSVTILRSTLDSCIYRIKTFTVNSDRKNGSD